jgi:hypothetical protein
MFENEGDATRIRLGRGVIRQANAIMSSNGSAASGDKHIIGLYSVLSCEHD